MRAFLLSLLLFLFWTIVGQAVMTALRTRRNVMQKLLLAPVVGISITALAVFWLNRLGLPVKQFAVYLTLTLLAASLAALWIHRPVIPVGRMLPFGAVLFGGLLVAGWPLLLHGFEWTAYANNDMLTLSNAAQYLLDFGLFDGPNAEDLIHGRNYSEYSWFLYAVGMHRIGNEVLLSWVAGVCQLRPDQVYMPLTAALQMVQIGATGALVLQSRRLRLAALLTCILVALSALGVQAVANQLSAQVGGLALLAGAATLWMQRSLHKNGGTWRHWVLTGLVTAGMLLYYPEMLPFLVLSVGLFFAIGLLRREVPLNLSLKWTAVALLTTVVVLNKQLVPVAVHLWLQISGGVAAPEVVETTMFPFFFKPVGLAILWGFQTLNLPVAQPLGSLLAVAGALLLLCAAAAAAWQGYRRTPVALVAVTMLLVAVRLYVTKSDFGLFKIMFFLQPFVLGTLVVAWFGLVQSRWLRVVPLTLLALAGVNSAVFYIRLAADQTGGATEIWKGSSSRIKQEIEGIARSLPTENVILDTPQLVLARLQALQLRDKEAAFAFDMADIESAGSGRLGGPQLAIHARMRPEVLAKFRDMERLMLAQKAIRYPASRFDLGTGREPLSFPAPRFSSVEKSWLVMTTGRQSLFNRRSLGQSRNSFVAKPWTETSNHLIFINTPRGRQYMLTMLAGKGETAFYQLESDYFFPGQTMAGIGSTLLFRLVNPSKNVRLVMDITSSYKGDGENLLPPATVTGASRIAFPLAGRGAARVFSESIAPQWINGDPYLAVEMNVTGKPFPAEENWLMSLYGEKIRVDRRALVAFARDISLVSEEEYQSLSAPRSVSRFPADLAQPALEYSGMYEDGWMSEATSFTLSQQGAGLLRIEGMIPYVADKAFKTDLSVLVDGQEVVRRSLALGDFSVMAPVTPGPAKRRVELRFTRSQRFLGADKRLTTAKLNYIGFDSPDSKRVQNKEEK